MPRIVFLGSKQLGLRVLQLMGRLDRASVAGVITIDDRVDGRSVLEEYESYCAAENLTLHIAASREHADELTRSLQPDLCFVVGWYWLFKDEILRLPARGFTGIHNSLLPRYRGGAPLVWALINGEREVGSSLFSFTPGMDDGPVWAQATVPVGGDDSIGEVSARLEAAMLNKLEEVYLPMVRGELTPQPQEEALATWCAQRSPEDGLIDWAQPARAVHDFIRAQSQPYPGAFTWLGQRKITIWKARVFAQPFDGPPGQVARVDGRDVFVTCGARSAVILERVQFDGGEADAGAVLRSIRQRFTAAPVTRQ